MTRESLLPVGTGIHHSINSIIVTVHWDVCFYCWFVKVRVLAVNAVGQSRPSETSEATRTQLRVGVFGSRDPPKAAAELSSSSSPVSFAGQYGRTEGGEGSDKPLVARIEPIDHFYKIEGKRSTFLVCYSPVLDLLQRHAHTSF